MRERTVAESGTTSGDERAPALYTETYRPQVHFSAPENWINDPNGLVWHDGVFHLYYQLNPTGVDWGNMHWGHASSTDLVHWRHEPVALKADPWGLGYAFSGSAVVDRENTSGLGSAHAAPIVALYTNATVSGIQSQSIAYSVDGGTNWLPFDGNPVIPNPGRRDFRDPKVFRDASRGQWVMSLAAGDRIEFYRSPDLIHWDFSGVFTPPSGTRAGVLECPDLFPLVAADGSRRWVLVVSIAPTSIDDTACVAYFIGDFDGAAFTSSQPGVTWLDYGPDNYGAVTWDGVPYAGAHRVMIGWMSHWEYARGAPTYPWRGSMTVPRELRLDNRGGEHVLCSLPVAALQALHYDPLLVPSISVSSERARSVFAGLPADLLDTDLFFSWAENAQPEFGLRFENGHGECAEVRVDIARRILIVDRTAVGLEIPDPALTRRILAPITASGESLSLRVLKDTASVEVFADDGATVVSANLFWDRPLDRVAVFGDDGVSVAGKAARLASIWQQ